MIKSVNHLKLRYYLESLSKNYSRYSTNVQSDTESATSSTKANIDDHSSYDYPGEHIPTTSFQKSLLSVGSAVVSLTAPWRADGIATFGETSGYYALKFMKQKMSEDVEGSQILRDMPRINSRTVDLDYLANLPQNTIGRVYSDWLADNRADPDLRPVLHFVDDKSLAYVMVRYREIHDLTHAVLGMPTHFLGEVTVKWVEGLQTGLPLCLFGGLFGALRLRPKQRQFYYNTHFRYAMTSGYSARRLMSCYFERRWEQDIDEFRREFNISTPPETMKKMW